MIYKPPIKKEKKKKETNEYVNLLEECIDLPGCVKN